MRDLLDWLRENFPDSKITPQDNGRYVLMNSPMRYDRTPSLMVWTDKGNWRDLGGNHEEGFLDELCERTGKDVPKIDGAPARKRTDEGKAEEDARKTKRAAQEWNYATPATAKHKYLKAKGITDTFGLRVNRKGQLVIPGVDLRTDEFRMIQTVDDHLNAEGKWHKNDTGPATFSGWYVGGERGDEHSSLVLAEGPATAATIKAMFPGMAVLCTFGADNIEADYGILRKRFPSREIILASDSGTEELASKLKGALPVIPSAARSNVDWNDVAVELGSEEARRQFTQKLESARAKTPKRINPLSLLCGPSPDKAVPPETVWLFPRGHLSVLASDPGAGKSMLMACAAADLSRGGRIIGGKEEPARKILYLNGEAGKALFDSRFRLGGWSFNPDNLKVVHLEEAQASEIALELDSEKGRQTIEALVESAHPDLLIVDSLIAFFSGDQNDAQAVRDVTVFLKRLAAKYGMAACLIHHLRKRGIRDTGVEVTLNEIQGSNAILKLVNVVVGIETRKSDDDEPVTRVVRTLKSWSRPFSPFAFTFEDGDDDSFRLVFDHEPVMCDRGKRGAWEAIFRAFGRGESFSRGAAESVCGVSDSLARRYLRDWLSVGKLTREGNARATEYRIVQNPSLGEIPVYPKKGSGYSINPVIPRKESGTIGSGLVPDKFRILEKDDEKESGTSESIRYLSGTIGSGWDRCAARLCAESGTGSGYAGGGIPVPETQPVETPKVEQGSLPRGSIQALAQRVGVSKETIRTSLVPWESCGRISLSDDGTIYEIPNGRVPSDDVPEETEEPDTENVPVPEDEFPMLPDAQGETELPFDVPKESPENSLPRGASAPGPLVEVETFPDDMTLPYEWPGHGWIVGVTRTGSGERSFMIAKSPTGKPVCALREPKRSTGAAS